MKKLAEIVCALILFSYPVSAYAEASTEPWTAPLQTTTFITPGLSYSILLPPIKAYQFGALQRRTTVSATVFSEKPFLLQTVQKKSMSPPYTDAIRIKGRRPDSI